MSPFSSKLPHLGTTIFTTMSKMAMDHDAINLSQGYPDFDAPQALIDGVSHYLNAGYNQYPAMIGVERLREQIAIKNLRLYGANIDHDQEITITSGATEALFVAIQTVVNLSDEVIVFDPAYDSYEPAITLAGGTTVHLPLDLEFNIDWQMVRDAINTKTKLIIINSPHNPSGSILLETDLAALVEIIERHDLYLISDEVYEHMVYDGAPHLSLLGDERLRARSFVISSFGKTYHATGWKVGHCIAPAALSNEFRKIHQYVTFTTHTASQWALADFMAEAPEHYLGLSDFYQIKRDHFASLLEASAFKLVPSQGTYFQLVDYSDISSMEDTAFAEYLTREIGVAAIPISVFYETAPKQRIVRFCFAKHEATLAEACEKLKRLEACMDG